MSDNNKLGVALVKELCLICTKEIDGPILLNTRLTELYAKNVEEMHGKVIGWKEEPCDECKKMLEQAFLFIGIDESKSDLNNLPEGFYRTGHIIGVKKDIPLITEFIKTNQPEAIKKGFIFAPLKLMIDFGLIQK